VPGEGFRLDAGEEAAAAFLTEARRDKIRRLVESYVEKYEGQ